MEGFEQGPVESDTSQIFRSWEDSKKDYFYRRFLFISWELLAMIKQRVCGLLLLAMVGLMGCSEEPLESEQPVNPPKKKEVVQEENKDVKSTPAEQEVAFTYNAENRRNPFKPLISPKIEPKEVVAVSRPQAVLTPLERYDTHEYKLVGVIAGRGGDYAMVESPDGKTYNFKVGTRIGKREGVVQKITDGEVVIKEIIRYDTGDTKEVETTLSLNKPNEQGAR